MSNTCDVVVVGAGFAGLTAARDLGQAGLSVIVLEGRDRIGGRTFTDERLGRPLELGGTYVHWTQAHLWREMKRHGIELSTPLPIEKVHWLVEGAVHSGSEADADRIGGVGMDALFADSREHFPYPQDVYAFPIDEIDKESIADRMRSLDLDPVERDLLDGMMSYTVSDPEQQAVSQLLRWGSLYHGNWRTLWESGAYWRMESGTKSLADALAAESGADIRLSTPVASIDDSGEGVVVTTRAGETIAARAVIVTAPVNALGTIEFTPALRLPTQRLIEEGQPMLNRKLWVRVKGAIEPFTGYAPIGENPITIAMTEYRVEDDTLIVCFAPDTTAIDFEDPGAVQQALRAFVPDLEVVAVTGHDWADDEFSQGTWMMMRPGQLSELVPDIQRPHGRVHFAGSDIAPAFVGWIEGAVESGALVAGRIARELAQD